MRSIEDTGKVEVLFVPGIDNPADIFTKNLGRVKIEKIVPMLGLNIQRD